MDWPHRALPLIIFSTCSNLCCSNASLKTYSVVSICTSKKLALYGRKYGCKTQVATEREGSLKLQNKLTSSADTSNDSETTYAGIDCAKGRTGSHVAAAAARAEVNQPCSSSSSSRSGDSSGPGFGVSCHPCPDSARRSQRHE